MFLFRVTFDDNKGCGAVSEVNILANNFGIAYSKAIKCAEKKTKELHQDELNEEPKNRVPKSYVYIIDSIRKIENVDIR